MDREQYNNLRRGNNNRTRTLTAPCSTMSHSNMANRFHHFSHRMPEAFDTCNGNSHFQNHTYHATQIRDHTTNNAQFKSMNTLQEQQGFCHRG